MAITIRRAEKENRVLAILTFAKRLEHLLSEGEIPITLNVELYKEIDKAPSIGDAAAASKRTELDKQGTKLWNMTSKLRHAKVNDGELQSLVRVFACLLLDCAQRCVQASTSNDIRVLKSTLRASKFCLGELSPSILALFNKLNEGAEQRQLSLAEIVVERAAFYEQKLKTESLEREHIACRLMKEYHVLRIALAWRQERLDLAKVMLANLNPSQDSLDGLLAEEIVDVLFEIGRDQTKKAIWSEAAWWLEKAHEVSDQNSEPLSSNAEELLVSIQHSLVRALINLDGTSNKERAWNIVNNLEIDRGDTFAMLILKLDLYETDVGHSSQDYCDVLHKIVRTVHLTDTNIKTILYHVHKLRSRSPVMAHAVLNVLLSERLIGAEKTSWLEKTLVTIVWNCTTSSDIPDILSSLRKLLDAVAPGLDKALSPSATHAAHILLWRRIESSYNQEFYEAAEAWCRLSLHEVFGSSGGMNVGKLQRKIMICALSTSNLAAAREVFFRMSALTKKDLSTQYLMYKIALKCKDRELASQCLESISSGSTKDATLLYACVLEAQRAGDSFQIIKSLQQVLDKHNYDAPTGIHLPALLRCTARLLMREIDSSQPQVRDYVNDICKLFEGAAGQAKYLERNPKAEPFSLAELDWFSRNSYNIALKACTSWDPRQTLRLIHSCLKFIDLYPGDLDSNISEDLLLRRLFCDFLSGSLFIVLARNDDQLEEQLQYYINVRKVVEDFRTHLKMQLSRLEGGAREDLCRKNDSLLAFDFEAAARLKGWDSLGHIVEEYQDREGRDLMVYATMADIVLASEAPSDVMITILEKIINVTWRHDGQNNEKLCRWIRCLFSLALTSNTAIAEQLLEQVVTIAEGQKKQLKSYPLEELEWLSTTAFNRAIDFFCWGQDIDCRRWAEKALAISEQCEDEGFLYGTLQQKYQSLVWHER